MTLFLSLGLLYCYLVGKSVFVERVIYSIIFTKFQLLDTIIGHKNAVKSFTGFSHRFPFNTIFIFMSRSSTFSSSF